MDHLSFSLSESISSLLAARKKISIQVTLHPLRWGGIRSDRIRIQRTWKTQNTTQGKDTLSFFNLITLKVQLIQPERGIY